MLGSGRMKEYKEGRQKLVYAIKESILHVHVVKYYSLELHMDGDSDQCDSRQQ